LSHRYVRNWYVEHAFIKKTSTNNGVAISWHFKIKKWVAIFCFEKMVTLPTYLAWVYKEN
jgi:hypothetical protein